MLASLDHIGEATIQIEKTLANILEGFVMEPQESDSIRMALLCFDMLGKLNPAHQEPIFTPLVLVKPDFEPLLWGLDVLEDTNKTVNVSICTWSYLMPILYFFVI